MRNIITVGSANINAFGFQSFFDLKTKKLTFDITGLTTFLTGGISNVLGICFSVIGPGGVVLATIDFTAPHITPASTSTVVFDLPNLYAIFGWYQIKGVIKDQDGVEYTTPLITKEITQPDGFANGVVPGDIEMTANCMIPQLLITDKTNLSYQKLSPATTVKTGVLSYPKSTLADLSFARTPFTVSGSGHVYTGRYTINNTSLCSYDLQDGVIVKITYLVTQYESTVTCNGNIGDLICCVDEARDTYKNNPYSNIGKAAKQRLDEVAAIVFSACAKQIAGIDCSNEVAQVRKILLCDCGCGSNSDLIEPRPILTGSLLGTSVVVTGINAAVATPTEAGDQITYEINVKNVIVAAADDDETNFTIKKTVTDNQINYLVSFNMDVLAGSILNSIGTDVQLLALLNSLITNNSATSLNGFAGSCVITMANCNYKLIEQNNITKTLVSITIANVVRTAPTGLLLTNAAGIQTWLNGLSLGTFAATYDSGSKTLLIESNTNANLVTTLIWSTAQGNLTRLFTRSCAGLVEILNAIVTYLCALTGEKVKYGATGTQLSTYGDNFAINLLNISSDTALTSLISQIITAQNALYNRLATVALTCKNIKTIFGTVDQTLISTDGVLGTKNGQCALIPFAEMMDIMLKQILGSVDLQSRLCGLTANCAGPVCAPVTNPSAVFASGTLTVNCNNSGGGTTPIKIFYRINNSGLTFIEVDCTAADLPKAIGAGALAAGEYEIQVAKVCSNGVQSPFATAISNNTCPKPISFSVAVSGSNFVASAELTSPQTKIEITMTDPNGGVTTNIYDLGGQIGTQNIAIPTGIYGTYNFIARAVCTTSPLVASLFTNPVNVNYDNPSANNIRLVGGYALSLTDCRSGTASGIPTSFNSRTVAGIFNDHTDSLSTGTITGTVTGVLPGVDVFVRLVKNGISIVSSSQLIGSSPYSFNLTNNALIVYPETISIEIDS